MINQKKQGLLFLVATGCSLALTLLTITPPVIGGDWARLDQFGKYIPNIVVFDWPRYEVQIAIWFGLILSLWLAFRSQSSRFIPNIPSLRSSSKKSLAVLVIIITLGFGLRLYTLGNLPLLIDEIGFAARASDMLHGQYVPIFAPGHNGNPAVFSWLLSQIMSVWGQTRFAVRLLSLFIGTLTIPAAFAFGQSWWSWRVGLIAALFVAFYPAHVHFSRLALYNIIDPFFSLLALTGLAYVHRCGKVVDFAWVGFWGGVAQYFYHGSRLLPVLIAVYVFISIIGPKWRDNNIKMARKSVGLSRFLVVVFVFLLVTLPRFAPMFTAGLPITGNLDIFRLPSDLGTNTVRSILAWVGERDRSLFWLSDSPLIAFFPLLCFLTGVLISFRKIFDPRYGVLMAALFLTTVLGGAIWTAAPLYIRYMTALPAIGLLVGLPFETLLKKREKNYALGLALMLLMLIVVQGTVLSIQHTYDANMRVPIGLWEADTLARAASQLPTGTEAHFYVSDTFGVVERVTIADYVAFYGERRAVSVEVK